MMQGTQAGRLRKSWSLEGSCGRKRRKLQKGGFQTYFSRGRLIREGTKGKLRGRCDTIYHNGPGGNAGWSG